MLGIKRLLANYAVDIVIDAVENLVEDSDNSVAEFTANNLKRNKTVIKRKLKGKLRKIKQ